MAAEKRQPSAFANLLNQIMNWPVKKKTLFGSVLVVMVLLIFLVLRSIGDDEFQLLYANLHPDDYIALSRWLSLRDIEFKNDPAQHSIYIAAGRVHKTRLDLAEHKLPSALEHVNEVTDNGVPALLDAITGTSPLIALQRELARTIGSLNHIRSARVHLIFPTEDGGSITPPRATVLLSLLPGRPLTSIELQGVFHLLAASVSGLKPENIRIYDSSGKLLSSDIGVQTTTFGPDSTLAYQAAVERSLEKKTLEVVEAMIGRGQARISVAAHLDFVRNETISERYDPEEPVVKSEHQQREPVDRQLAGVEDEDLSDTGSSTRHRSSVATSSKVDYEISKTTSKTIHPAGQITQLSVTLLVADQKTIGADGTISFEPRTEEQLEELKSLVASTVPLKPERGDTIFVARLGDHYISDQVIPTEMPALNEIISRIPVGKISLIAVVFLLFYLLLLKPLFDLLHNERSGHAGATAEHGKVTIAESEPTLEQEDLATLLRNEITSDPAAAAHVIRKWIKEA